MYAVVQQSVSGVTFSDFELISLSILIVKSTIYPQDMVPTHLLKQFFESVGAFMVSIINMSLLLGVVSDYCKHAVVQPLEKIKLG